MRYIQTSEDTWREETAADRLEKVVAEVSKNKSKEPLDWKLLIGLKQPL